MVLILTFQLAGELVARSTGVPVPGPVIGMALFFIFLQVRQPSEHAGVVRAGDQLLAWMTVFFIPPAVGFVVYLPQLAEAWWPTLVGLVGSWLVALLATAGFAALLRPRRRPAAAAETGGDR